MDARVHYEGWSWWVHLLIWITFLPAVFALIELARRNVGPGEGAMSPMEAVFLLLLGLGIPLCIYVFMGRLRARVTSTGVEMSWGWAGIVRKTIPFSQIGDAEAVTYSPVAEFGGWGIRMGGQKKRAWNIRGSRAVLLHLSDGTRFYLGSDRPERMVEWIRAVGKGKMAGSDAGERERADHSL